MKEKIKNNLEYICVFTITVLLFFFIVFYIKYLNKFIKIPQCFLYKKTGIYCLGCGATRALYSLISGNVFRSIYYNPFVLYIIGVDVYFLITESISKVFKRKNNFFIRNINIYIYIGIFILILNWLIKVIVLKCMGIALI